MERVLTGRTAIVTGANQGFGLAVARAFAMAGANLMLCGRNTELLGRARREIESLATADQEIMAYPADVAKPDDVEKLVANTLGMQRGLHVLVNNAGIYGPKGLIEEVDWGDWVKAIEINLLGSVLMCRAVLPHLRKNRYGKIIQLSGGGATNPLPRISAYAASKAAIVRFAETLAEEVRDDNIGVNAIAPGALNTRLLDEVLEAGPEKVGEGFYDRAVKQKEQGGAPLQKGADLAIFLASSASDGITGKLISAVWDPWERFPGHLDTLNRSDIYTLRRIVPKDRAQNWGDK
ncbi:MAG: SDR family oxidoreductase [Proteobacteria bacterium]|nr:SDR family oxidoreductase [Pseudomonadota bacterium]